MELTTSTCGTARVITPQGRIDQTTAEGFQKAVEPYLSDCKSDGPALILDFCAVPYISSVGLRALMLAARQVGAQHGRLAIAAMTPTVREVFAISRFDMVLKTFDSVESAATALP